VSPGQPRWRRTFDTAERAVGRPLENVVASPRYLDVAMFGRRVKALAGSVISAPMTTVRHVLSVPARSDIGKLTRQIATLTNEVRDLAAEVDELRRPMPKRASPESATNAVRRPPSSPGRQSRRASSTDA
jgi:hypothetical protein